jgi:hypothetical protein
MRTKDMRLGREGGLVADDDAWNLGPDESMDPLLGLRVARLGGDVDEELRELERCYWQALKDRDVEAMRRLTDEECFLAGAQGVRRVHPEDLAGLGPHTTLDDFEIGAIQVRRIGADVAILAYEVHEELTVEGEHVSIDAADASTWIHRDGRWVCALHAEALTGDPFGRDRGSSGGSMAA